MQVDLTTAQLVADDKVYLGIELDWIVPKVCENHLDLVVAESFHGKVLLYDCVIYEI